MSQTGGKPRGSSGRRISVHCGLHAGGPGPEGERHSGGGLSGCRPAPGGDPGGGAGWGRICGPDPDWSEDLLRGRGPVRPCFYFDELQGKVRVTCKGIGHGYGFSQAGASALEKEGLGFEALLDHYFQNVEILKEGI